MRAHADAIIELADRHNLGYWPVNGLILRGWAMAQEGAPEAGIDQMLHSAADRAALGVSWYQACYLRMLAATCARSRRAAEGSRVIAEAKDLVARNNEHMWVSELDRLEGQLRWAQGASVPDVEVCFQKALAVSRRQGAKSFELRAATSLARLWREQGKRAEARDLLAPVYGWFTEGFDTPDLKDAKTVSDELS